MKKNLWFIGGGLLLLASVITACGSGSSLTKENIALTLVASDDGFAFPNFGAVGTPEVFDGSDLAAMFGGVACVGGVVDPCAPTAVAASWAQMVNQARASGHCEGIVVQAAVRYNNQETPKTVQLAKDSEVDHAIMRAFATQFLPEVQEETNGWQKKSLEDILGALSDSFRGPDVEGSSLFGIRANVALSNLGEAEYTMGLYSEEGGHAVLPYAIDFPDDNTAIIHVYDSNWPGRSDRFVRVDLSTGEWFFSFSGQDPNNDACQWTGKKGDMDLTSLTTRTNATVPFGDGSQTVKGSMLVIKAKAGNWSVTTSAGTFSPADGKTVDGIEASSIKGASVACGKPALTEYTVYTTDSNVELNLPDAASVTVVNDGAITQVQTQGQGIKKPIVITPKAVSVDDVNVQLTVAQGNKIVQVNGVDTTIEISDLFIVNVTSSTGEEITQVVDDASPQLQIVTSADPANQTIVVTSQTVDKVVTQTNIATDGTKTVVYNAPQLQIVNVVNQTPIVDLGVKNKELPVTEVFVPTANPVTSSTAAVGKACIINGTTLPGVYNSFLVCAAVSTSTPTSTTTTSVASTVAVGQACIISGTTLPGVYNSFLVCAAVSTSTPTSTTTTSVASTVAVGQACIISGTTLPGVYNSFLVCAAISTPTTTSTAPVLTTTTSVAPTVAVGQACIISGTTLPGVYNSYLVCVAS